MAAPPKALVLAAGTGSRLRPLTADRPKALVEVAGATVLERLLDVCAAVGIAEAVVVVGHGASALERWLGEHPHPVAVAAVHNEQYASINNAHSVLVARQALDGADFIKLDGDLLLDSGIVGRLLASAWPSAAVIERRGELDAEAMKARVDETGRVTALGKWLEPAEGAGESIGVEKIAAADADRLFEAIERVVHRQGRHEAYYEDVYHVLLGEGWTLGACDTAGLWWAEIDTPQDLAAAEAHLGEPPR